MGILMLNGNNYTGGIQQVYGKSSGDIATFDDGGDNKPLKSLKVAINPVQSGSEAPSPSNVRPISGWDSVSCVTDGSCVDTLTPLYNTTYYSLYFSKATIQAEPNTDYYVNSNSPNALIQSRTLETTFIVCPEEDTPSTVNFGVVNGEELHIKTKSSGAIAIYYRVKKGSSGIIQLTTPQDFKDGTYYLQITKTSTNNQRLGATYTIQLGNTYYGGTLDVTSGVLTVTHANIASYNGESINEPWISSEDAYESGATPTTGAQVVYPLTTPLTVQLTPTQVKTLLGDNNIWSDTGEILECVYQRDLNLVINQFDARITALEQALNSSGTRSLSLSKSAVKEEETEEITEEPKEEEQNEDKR